MRFLRFFVFVFVAARGELTVAQLHFSQCGADMLGILKAHNGEQNSFRHVPNIVSLTGNNFYLKLRSARLNQPQDDGTRIYPALLAKIIWMFQNAPPLEIERGIAHGYISVDCYRNFRS
jgi:hypothetical protein